MTFLGPIAAACLVVSTVASCSSSGDGDDLVIVADDSGWTASGGSVDARVMCPEGKQHQIGYLELDGSPLAPHEGFERLVDGIQDDPLDEVADFLGLHEFTCADGSGSFTVVAEGRNDGPWSVSEGTGGYTNLQASGTLEIERRLSDEPDSPPGGLPGGMPHDMIFTGVIEIAD